MAPGSGMHPSGRRQPEEADVSHAPDFAPLFHRLNNQLGIVLANAELLEAKLADEAMRARAAQIVTSVLEALGTARELRAQISRSAP